MTRREGSGTFANIDGLTLMLYILLVGVGWLAIYSAEYNEVSANSFALSMSHGKQLLNIAIGFVLGLFLLLLDHRLYHTVAPLVYAATMGLLVLTIFIGREVAGAKGWIDLGFFQLQTAELAKFATALFLAHHIGTYEFSMRKMRDRLLCFGIIGLPIILILLQNDTGSAMVFLSLFFVLYRFGLPAIFLILPLWLMVVCLAVLLVQPIPVLVVVGLVTLLFLLIARSNRKLTLVGLSASTLTIGVIFSVDYIFNNVLHLYQQERIKVLLGMKIDPRGVGYNVMQSKIAIGSGGLTGKGFLDGTMTKLNFVPEHTTDFIFCTIGEEFGWAGSLVLVILYTLLFVRLIQIAERQADNFTRAYAYGVLSILFFHFLINLSMTIGLFPIVGIPLPFISYGGSSMLGFTILLFILLKLDSAQRDALR